MGTVMSYIELEDKIKELEKRIKKLENRPSIINNYYSYSQPTSPPVYPINPLYPVWTGNGT